MAQVYFERYKLAAFSLISLLIINWLLAAATERFVLLAQRHLSHALGGALLIVLAIFVLFLLTATTLLATKLFETANAVRKQSVLVIISFALTLNFGYWLYAVFVSDSACVKCGGYSETLYFWMNPRNLHQ